MIKGIGIDAFSINRMMFLKDKANDPFVKRSFTENERLQASEGRKLVYLTGRFSAKEAVYKCIGGLFYLDFKPEEIEIINNELGRPIVNLYGDTLKAVSQLKNYTIHVSITYENDMAMSFAVLESEEE